MVIYFHFERPKLWLNVIFGLMLFMLCIRIEKSIFHVFMDLDKIYLQIGLSACIMVGPLMFLYVKDFLGNIQMPKIVDWSHLFIPFNAIIILSTIWPDKKLPQNLKLPNHKIIYGTGVFSTIISFF